MKFTFWKILAAIGLFLLALSTVSLYTQLELPKPAGPFVVGRSSFRWTDTSRPEALTSDPGDFREVVAWVWYPAEQGTGKRAGYFPDLTGLLHALVQSGEVAWWEAQGLRLVRAEIGVDAQPLRGRAPYPVVLFSPGNGTNIEFYSSLAAEIASHGYIVVGLNHPYDVAAVQVSEGRIALYNREQWSLEVAEHQAYISGRIDVRVADILFVMDQLEMFNIDPNNSFVGILDLGSVAAAGHSLGGITASEACKADLRFRACLNFDGLQQGGPFSMDPSAVPPSQPFLFLTKEADLHPKIVQRFGSTSESYWVVVHGASHDNFTDGPLLRPSLLQVPNQADRSMNSIQEYTLAFLDQTLKDRANSSISNSIETEDVSVRVYPSEG